MKAPKQQGQNHDPAKAAVFAAYNAPITSATDPLGQMSTFMSAAERPAATYATATTVTSN